MTSPWSLTSVSLIILDKLLKNHFLSDSERERLAGRKEPWSKGSLLAAAV